MCNTLWCHTRDLPVVIWIYRTEKKEEKNIFKNIKYITVAAVL